MKTKTLFSIFLYVLFTISVFSLFSCDYISIKERKEIEGRKRKEFFQGPHELRKMVNWKSQEGSLSGGYFLFVGGVSGSMSSNLKVTFSWKAGDEDFITTTLDVEKIKVRINSKREDPIIYIKEKSFHMHYSFDSDNPTDVNDLIDYVTIECKEEDWGLNVDLPLENIP